MPPGYLERYGKSGAIIRLAQNKSNEICQFSIGTF